MFSAASLLTTLLLALSIAATPVVVRSSHVTLPLAKCLHTNGSAISLVQRDQTRATALKARVAAIQSDTLDRRADSVAVTNGAVTYTVAVGIGSPPTIFNLIVDTGSSNTWVGANTPYTQTSTSMDTGDSVSLTYGSGFFSGEEWLDTVTLGSGLTISQQSIGVASTSDGFDGSDGILGIGPETLTTNSLTNEPDASVPTVTQNLYGQGTISEEVVGVFFAPSIAMNDENGELTFGGIDASKYTGILTYTPLTEATPAADYWGIEESITYGSSIILAETAGIVDTGTTMILLASDAFTAYKSATGGTLDNTSGMLKFTAAQYDNLQTLNFNIGSVTYALTRNGQIWPRSLNVYIGGTAGAIYGIVNDIGTPSGEGLDFINGQAFLERFYSVYDTTNARVGFATTAYTNATTN